MHTSHHFFRAILLTVTVLICLAVWGQNELPLGDNLVVNGDFENGNTGFESQYSFFTNTLPDPGGGRYCIDVDASAHYGNGSNQPWLGNGNDGQGNYDTHSKFMIVSGAGASQYVWQYTANVKPYTDYEFSAWICHLYKSFGDDYTANVQFKINGVALGQLDSPNHRNGYVHFTSTWNSGSATTATLTIFDLNDNLDAGNDFGLDNISFKEMLVVGPISRLTPVCAGNSLELTAPELFCQGCNGQWEILQGNSIVATYTSNAISNVPMSWNGCYLRYAVNYQEVWHYSNTVQLFVTMGLDVDIQIVEGATTMCEGDTVVLHASVTNDVMNYDFITVGDILCTDGSIVHSADWSTAGKVAKGIVFFVDSTEVHGWAIGLNEKSYVKWSQNNGSVPGLQPYSQIRSAIRDFHGKDHTEKITAAGNQSQYPAAWYCTSLGGYLPSIGQVNALFRVLAEVNNSMNVVGGVPFAVSGNGWFLLSSTVQSTSNVYYIDRSGAVQSGDKTYPGSNYGALRIVRPVFDF